MVFKFSNVTDQDDLMIGDSANTPVKEKPEFMRNFSSKTLNKREKSSQKYSASEFIWGPDQGGDWELGHREFKPILQLSTPYVFIFDIHWVDAYVGYLTPHGVLILYLHESFLCETVTVQVLQLCFFIR